MTVRISVLWDALGEDLKLLCVAINAFVIADKVGRNYCLVIVLVTNTCLNIFVIVYIFEEFICAFVYNYIFLYIYYTFL